MSAISRFERAAREAKIAKYAKNFTRAALAEFVVEHEEQIEKLKKRLNDLQGDLEIASRTLDDCSAFLED